jgi:hypothetical protein
MRWAPAQTEGRVGPTQRATGGIARASGRSLAMPTRLRHTCRSAAVPAMKTALSQRSVARRPMVAPGAARLARVPLEKDREARGPWWGGRSALVSWRNAPRGSRHLICGDLSCVNRWREGKMFLTCSCQSRVHLRCPSFGPRDNSACSAYVLGGLSATLVNSPQSRGSEPFDGGCRMNELPAFCPQCRRRTISVEQHLDHHERVTPDRCCDGLKARGWRCAYAR